jgi:S1-C subfamily serine protease
MKEIMYMKLTIASAPLLMLAILVASSGCTRNSAPTQEQQRSSQRAISDIAHDSVKSVVTVVTYDATGRTLGLGSGFFVSTDGKVVTNYHVIDGAGSAIVKLADGGIYVVEGIVGADKEKDIAVLKLRASDR